MLACHRMCGSHTAENISDCFEQTISSYKFSDKINIIVTGNAANMVKAFRQPGFECSDENSDMNPVDITSEYDYLPPKRISCFANTLQLVVKDGLRDLGPMLDVLAKAASLGAHVRRSTAVSELLEDLPKLQSANNTRWNSQLMMVRSILRIPKARLDELNAPVSLSIYELKVLEELCEMLNPFEEATDHVQGEKVVTASKVVIWVRGLH